MIKRNIPKSIAPAEKLKEHSFTAMHAIDVTTAPTIRDNVYDITNMDVNLDGSLSIRKPLVFSNEHWLDNNLSPEYTPIKTEYLFDGKSIIQIYKNRDTGDIKIIGVGNKIYGVDTDVLEDNLDNVYFKGSDINIINTVNSTIISGLKINLRLFAKGKFFNNVLTDDYQYRYLKIIKEDDIFKCIFIQPEIPTIETSEIISLNYNTISDYAYAVKDNYQSQAIGVSAILPYVSKDKTISNFKEVSIEELTESENFITFSTVADTAVFSPYFIKAFLNVKSELLHNCYCTWEKSYDGVSWQTVPEFMSNFETTPIKIKDNTVSYESLTETYDNSRTVLFCKLNLISNTDKIINRPDVLVLKTIDSATYRFKIILIREEDAEVAEGISLKSFTPGELQINRDGHVGNIESTFKFVLDPNKTYTADKFEIKQTNVNTINTANLRTHGVSIGDFTYNLSMAVEGSENILTINVKYSNVSLLSGFAMQTIFATYAIIYGGVLVHTEYARHLVYYTQAYVDSLDTISLENIEQPYLSFYGIDYNTILIDILPDKGIYLDRIKAYTDTSKKIFKFSLDSVILKQIYDNLMYPIERELLNDSTLKHLVKRTSNPVHITDERFGIPEGWYYLTYFDGDVVIQYPPVDGNPPYYTLNFTAENAETTDYKNVFIFTASKVIANGSSDLDPDDYFLKIQTYFDSETTGKSYYSTENVYNGDTGNYILAWQGPKNYNQIYYRTPKSYYEGLPIYHSEIIKRVLEARTVLNIYEMSLNEDTKYLGALIDLRYLTEEGNLNPVTRYPNIVDNVYDTIYYTDKFEEIKVNSSLLDSASLELGQSSWTLFQSNYTELLDVDVPNTVPGNKLYYKHRIYTYGKEFKNCIYVSDSDSFTTPIFNMIDLNASEESYVTTLIPWRDYLIAATTTSIYLIRETESGFTSKIINTYIGIPEKDAKTCKAILNGIVFKSGTKIYSLQPSVYSNDDTILNIMDISKTIANYIPEGVSNNFAITTEQAYYLIIPNTVDTLCLKYEFSRKLWTKHVYPVRFTDYYMKSIENISIFSEFLEYSFEKEYISENENELYGDVLVDGVTPISFMFDSGQKTDDLSSTKQFVESKLILATLHDKDTFPLNVDIFIDGVEFSQLHFDSSTDGALWKTSNKDTLTLSTTGYSENQDLFNTMRQMILRYSGKGKSIRHKISGTSSFNFKFYVLYYRYKNTHNKQ